MSRGKRGRTAFRNRTTIYRYGYSPEFFWFIAALFALIAGSLLIIPPASLWQLVVVPLNLGLAAFFWRMSRMGARLDDQGIRVVRMVRTISVPWSQFRRFVMLPRPRDLLSKTGYLERTDGSLVWIQGLAPWGPLIKRSDDFAVDAMIAEMNRKARKLKAVAESAAATT